MQSVGKFYKFQSQKGGESHITILNKSYTNSSKTTSKVKLKHGVRTWGRERMNITPF